MGRQVGSPRRLTQSQIRRVLRWHARLIAFRREHSTVQRFARSMGPSVPAIRRALGSANSATQLSRAQRRMVRRWYARYRRFVARQQSAQALADALKVSRWTIFDCIRRQGRYFQLDERALHRQARQPATRARSARRVRFVEDSQRAALLKAWRAVDAQTDCIRTARRPRRSRGLLS